MSSSERQNGDEMIRPFFTKAEAVEAEPQVTGLFDPRPQDVRPWALFERQEVVKEAFGADEEPEEALADASLGALDEESEEPPALDAEALDDDSETLEAAVGEDESSEGDGDQADEVEREAQAVASDALGDKPEGEDALEAAESLPEVGEDEGGLESPEEVAELLDSTMTDEDPTLAAEQDAPEEPCPHCEATQAAAESTLDATVEALQRPYLEGAQALERVAQDVSKDFVQNLLRLSLELASHVLRRTSELDPETVLSNFEGAVDIAGPLSELVVRCHPEDAELLRAEGPARAEAITGRLVEIAVRPTESLARGACIVDFEDGLVDARWNVQLERLADAISPTLIHHAAERAMETVTETQTPPDEEGEAMTMSNESPVDASTDVTIDDEALTSVASDASTDELGPNPADESSNTAEEETE